MVLLHFCVPYSILTFLFFISSPNFTVVLSPLAPSLGFHSYKSVTNFYRKHKGKKTVLGQFLSHLVTKDLPSGKGEDDFPEEFNAWLVFRNVVDLILFSDVYTYILLGVKCFVWPETFGLWDYFRFAAGLVLVAFNNWAKVDAHRCIGDYCWYWGDFFFLRDLNLTFDGIFELFPHPMYTVGYSFYYGYSLMTNSYTMLFVSVWAHMMQLIFLTIVEEPHIQKTYGSTEPNINSDEYRILYDPKHGLFPGKKPPLFLVHLDFYRSGDISLAALVFYCALCSYYMSLTFCVLQVLVWLAVKWIGISYVLFAQSKRQWWTRHYTDRGRTLYEAFDDWKRVYNIALTMNFVSFVCLAFKAFPFATFSFTSGLDMTYVVIGGLLIALNVWSSTSSFAAVGDFGWFYGDFFIPEQQFKSPLVYTGIYRYMNNPDCFLGHLAFYGMAVVSQSSTLIVLAVLSQVSHFIFLNSVEVPHMNSLYSDQKVRRRGPISRQLHGQIQKVIPLDEEETARLSQQANKIKVKAMHQVYEIYSKIRDIKKSKSSTSIVAATIKVSPKSPVLGEPIVVAYKTDDSHADTDWIGIYPCDVKSAPGVSDGKWKYVPRGSEGEIKFENVSVPDTEGVYEVRYHSRNSYNIVASQLITVGGGAASPLAAKKKSKKTN